MSFATHLTELSERHKLLERRIEDALAHPSADNLEIIKLKREKLKLKDRIERLRQPSNGRAAMTAKR